MQVTTETTQEATGPEPEAEQEDDNEENEDNEGKGWFLRVKETIDRSLR